MKPRNPRKQLQRAVRGHSVKVYTPEQAIRGFARVFGSFEAEKIDYNGFQAVEGCLVMIHMEKHRKKKIDKRSITGGTTTVIERKHWKVVYTYIPLSVVRSLPAGTVITQHKHHWTVTQSIPL